MTTYTPVRLEGRTISLSNLDKPLWPREGYTKGDLIEYYARVAPYILPHLKDRPLVFTRYPNGIGGKFFYQKNFPTNLPDWINTFQWLSSDGSATRFIVAEEKAALVWLANQACIEIHPWISSQCSIDQPDFIVFDLDPPPGKPFIDVVDLAFLLKQLLNELGLRVYVKSSGALGLHVYLPVLKKYNYQQTRSFAEQVARIISRVIPSQATIERSVQQRGDKIYVDYLQNVLGKTICAPYSVRPRSGATVSLPLRWEELRDISPLQFTIKSIFTRLESLGDIFRPVLDNAQDLDFAINKLSKQNK